MKTSCKDFVPEEKITLGNTYFNCNMKTWRICAVFLKVKVFVLKKAILGGAMLTILLKFKYILYDT